MSSRKPQHAKSEDGPSRPQQVLKWALCHPGVLVLGSLAVGTALASRRENKKIAGRRMETEADLIDGDVPLFV